MATLHELVSGTGRQRRSGDAGLPISRIISMRASC
jgi:hypothetical protein